MTRRAFAASSRLVFKAPVSVIRAFQSAQPQPRAQVALSAASRARNTSGLSPERNVHATVTSQAGSPTAEDPEVDGSAQPALAGQQIAGTDVSVEPDRGAVPVAARAASHTCVAPPVSTSSPKAVIASLVSPS
jgi:hypothetical protein